MALVRQGTAVECSNLIPECLDKYLLFRIVRRHNRMQQLTYTDHVPTFTLPIQKHSFLLSDSKTCQLDRGPHNWVDAGSGLRRCDTSYFFFFFVSRACSHRCTAALEDFLYSPYPSPPCLDVPTFATRHPHVHNDARDPSSERWNWVGENWPVILPQIATFTSIQGSFTCRKSATWDTCLYFPSEGRRAEKFFALKNPDGFGRVWTRELGYLKAARYR